MLIVFCLVGFFSFLFKNSSLSSILYLECSSFKNFAGVSVFIISSSHILKNIGCIMNEEVSQEQQQQKPTKNGSTK